MQIRPMHMLPNRAFEQTVRMRMDERPRMMGMPMILGYYIRGN